MYRHYSDFKKMFRCKINDSKVKYVIIINGEQNVYIFKELFDICRTSGFIMLIESSHVQMSFQS